MSKYEADLTILQDELHCIYDRLENTNATLSLPLPNNMHVDAIRTILPEIIKQLKEALEASGYSELED